ncbi:hypothetical protein DSM112329_03703 [Paraconexibacter sp. AEG42_29]|uniref:Uncharacterized protein n=1 Tax=Paraconexibacter sp. AEG42_29 TaxID=2997339 RepID=A0AAU7AYY2_9ACTN
MSLSPTWRETHRLTTRTGRAGIRVTHPRQLLIARLAAPVIKPPARALTLPRRTTATKYCGTLRRAGRRLTVRVVRGPITCPRALRLATPPTLQGIRGWRWADWTPLPGPWVDAYRRADGKVVVATVPAGPRTRPRQRPSSRTARRAEWSLRPSSRRACT